MAFSYSPQRGGEARSATLKINLAGICTLEKKAALDKKSEMNNNYFPLDFERREEILLCFKLTVVENWAAISAIKNFGT